jgi:N6-L-threonylcarbamoyladenine synthase
LILIVEKMLILGIETSCDDTSASIVENGHRILSNVVSSQDEIHTQYGGIVPELASRQHILMVWPVVAETMKRADVNFRDLSAIAVSHGPGLVGSLLVGVCFAKSLSFANNLPLVAVNHLEGHIFSVFLESNPDFPFISLVVSGGHTSLYLVEGFTQFTEAGRTRDDAAGEAFDKVAKLMGYGYPGGPVIDDLAKKGDPEAISFPRANLSNSFDFSFSGLKTAVLNYIKRNPDYNKEDVAASFQAAVVDVLVSNTLDLVKSKGLKRATLSGGVSANSCLREKIKLHCAEHEVEIILPSKHLCTDNAAMIAATGYHYYHVGRLADFSLNPKAYLPAGVVHNL